jgi:putative tryptophan/tyrosine transport system substrate-binding protein
MRRRDILIVLGAALITPLGATAQSQSGKTWRIAFFGPGNTMLSELRSPRYRSVYGGFVQGMRELGHTEGRDFIIEPVTYDADKLDEAAREIVQHHVDLILAMTQSDIVLAAKRATHDIPIVFVIAGDPVASGIVTSMSRPGGNATGLTSLNASADAKRLELLKEAIPALRRVALLASRDDPATSSIASATRNAARSLGVELEVWSVERFDNLEGTLTAVVKAGSEAVIVAGSPVFFALQPRIAQWAGAARTPVISPWRELPGAGGLLSYGASVEAMFHQAAVFVDRILKGEKPSNLPVQAPTKYELVINLKTAKALGLTIPPSLLVQADEVIE